MPGMKENIDAAAGACAPAHAKPSGTEDKIVLRHVSKSLKGRPVLVEVSCELERGGIYGFRGPNESGKTMLFRAVAGLVRIDEGEIRVFGESIGKDASFPRSLGIVIESIGLWDEYTGFKNLKLLASIKKQASDDDVRSAIARVGLDPEERRTLRKYSLGMRQRLGIAQAIMEKPELLILDEPTNALDDRGKQLVRDIVRDEQARGATVLIASHDAPELEALCTRQFSLYEGRLREA